MCGIAGALGLGADLSPETSRVVESMTAALRHRGPDARRVLAAPRCALGNARLRVLDLSEAADLPRSSGGLRLAYNGMVTNFRQLGGDRSDSETLLKLYADKGIDFVRDLSGMFAFCLYDEARGKAWLARDPFGTRPLFYARAGSTLWFASELKALLEAPGVGREPDREALWHYLSLGYVPGERTAFSGVGELLEGRVLEADLETGELLERRYHRLRYGGGEASVEKVRELLLESTRRNLVADVPVGLSLSGGVDTSGLLGMAKHLGRARSLHTFSIVMDESSFDESPYQRIMVRYAEPIHHEVRVRAADVMANLGAAVAQLDEPLVNGAAVPMLMLAREARKHVGVLLSGEGGDEVFNAYETHRAHKARGLYRLVPAPLRAAARAAAAALPCDYRKLSLDFVAKRFTAGAELPEAEAHYYWRHVLDHDEKLALFRGEHRPTAALFADYYGQAEGEPLDRVSQLDLRYYFVDDLMVKNDRTICAHSLEPRFPYVDRELVEAVAAMPAGARLRGFEGRWIQKRALSPFVPPEILARTNMGLELPHSLWFLDGLRPLVAEVLTRERVEGTGLLRHEAVERLWADHLARRRDNGRALWAVVNLVLWHELFISRRDYKRHLACAS